MPAPPTLTILAARVGLVLALGPAPDGSGDPSDEINWLLDAPWGGFALLITFAMVVMYFAKRRMRGKIGAGLSRTPDFDLRVARLERLALTSLAEAQTGDVRVEGELARGEGALGTGPRACVYQNRFKSSRATAIAAELVLIEDDTGMLGVEGLADARVIAPKEEHGPHDTIGLYLGDRVEILGEAVIFDAPQTVGGRPLLGMLGSLGQVQIRVVDRPSAAEAKPDSTSDPDSDPTDSTDSTASEPPATSEAP